MEATLVVIGLLASLALNLVLAATLALVVKERGGVRRGAAVAPPALPATPAAHGGSRREVILDLARQGLAAEAIAQACGLSPGEVRLVLHLNAMEQSRQPATRRVAAA
jgi:DNA-binding NarL/FixJ family response regulator